MINNVIMHFTEAFLVDVFKLVCQDTCLLCWQWLKTYLSGKKSPHPE